MRFILMLFLSVILVACSNNDVEEKTTVNHTNVETASESDSPTSKEIYDYAQLEFDSLTSFGENYIPEKHDELVIQKTAEHFDLDYETTNQLYMEEATGVKDGTKFNSDPMEEATGVKDGTKFNSDTEYPSKMTMELFKLLKPDMTYEEVTALTDLEGTLDPLMSDISDGIESYIYDGIGYSNATLIFSDGKLYHITQAGLAETPEPRIDKYNELSKGMSFSEVFSLLGEGVYSGFSNSPNNGLLTTYSYKLNSHYMDFVFFDDSLFEIPALPSN